MVSLSLPRTFCSCIEDHVSDIATGRRVGVFSSELGQDALLALPSSTEPAVRGLALGPGRDVESRRGCSSGPFQVMETSRPSPPGSRSHQRELDVSSLATRPPYPRTASTRAASSRTMLSRESRRPTRATLEPAVDLIGPKPPSIEYLPVGPSR